jgi:hypothetical protein
MAQTAIFILVQTEAFENEGSEASSEFEPSEKAMTYIEG